MTSVNTDARQSAWRKHRAEARLLDTFVAAQLRPELVVSDSRPHLYHVRQQHGRYEVDLLAEVAPVM